MTRIDTTEASRRELWAILVGGSLLSCVVSYRVAARTLVLGSPGGGWVYQYLYPFQPHTLTVFAIVCACCGVMAMVSLTAVRRHEWLVVAMWLAIGLLSQALIRQLTPFSLEEMFISDGSNGFYSAARAHPPDELLADFNRLRQSFAADHARFNMPGKVLLVYALSLVSASPAVQAWLVVVLSSLGGILLYLFVRDFLDDRVSALVALVFYLFVPAKLLLFPVMNAVTPVFVLACAWFWLRLLLSRALKYAVALGVLAYAAVFFDPTSSVMGLLFVGLAGHALWRGEIGWRSVAALTGVTVIAFIACYVFMVALFGFDLASALKGVAADAVEFNSRVKRPYGTWVVRNLPDFAFGAGICQTVLFGWSVVRSSGRGLAAAGAAGRMAAFSLGIGLVLLVMDVSGINRGEVVRLWIFLACFVQVPAAYACARLESPGALLLVVVPTLLQTALSTSMMAFAQP